MDKTVRCECRFGKMFQANYEDCDKPPDYTTIDTVMREHQGKTKAIELAQKANLWEPGKEHKGSKNRRWGMS